VESPESVTGGEDPDVGVTRGQAFDRVWDGVQKLRSILVAHETKFHSLDQPPGVRPPFKFLHADMTQHLSSRPAVMELSKGGQVNSRTNSGYANA